MIRPLRQALSDYTRELGWAVLYGTLLAIVISGLVRVTLSWSVVIAQNESITRFEEAKVNAVVTGTLPFDARSADSIGNDALALDDYLSDVLSPGGKAGTFVDLPGESAGYPQLFDRTVVFLGAYAELTPYEPDASQGVSVAVSRDLADEAGGTIKLGGTTHELSAVPEDMDLFHPLWYVSTADFANTYQKTLFVFCPDYNLIRELLPELSYADPLGRLILLDPDTSDIVRLRQTALDARGMLADVRTVEEQNANDARTGLRTNALYLFFFATSTTVLSGAMLMNLHRLLAQKVPTYAICHLFGASFRECFVRAFLLAALYQAIPVAAAIWMMEQASLATPISLGCVIGLAGAACVILSFVTMQRVSLLAAHGMRGE